MIKEIDRASGQQRGGIEVLNQVAGKMDEATQHRAVFSKLAAGAVHSLDEWATNLNGTMSTFKLAGEG